MPNIKEFIKKIGSETVSLEEQQQALSEIEKTIKEVRQKREEEVGKSAKMVVDALKQIEQRLNDKFQELLATPAMVGAPGKDGKDGKDGKNGLPGPAGINGAPGKDGIDGEDGKDGVSVVDAKIDFDGSLVITLSNGNEIDAGLVIPTAVAEQYNAFMTRGEIIPLQTGNSGKYLTTDGNNLAWTSTGNFTSVAIDAPTTDATLTIDTGITGWVYSNKSVSVGTQDGTPQGVFFRPNGTEMFVVGSANDRIYKYTLGTAWDVSTASFNSQSPAITQDSTPIDLYISSDGLTVMILGNTNDTVYQYSLSVAWDVTTLTYASKSFSVTTQEATPAGMWFRPDGSTMYIVGTSADTVFQYTLSTPWDISTASYANISFSISSQEGSSQQVNLSSDGTKMWVAGNTGDDINEYNLGTAWNISTATFVNNVYIGFQETGLTGLFIDSTAANRVYIVGSTNDTVYQYNTATNTVDVTTDRLFVSGEGYVDGNFVAGNNAYVDGGLTVQGTSSFTTTNVSGTLTASAAVNFSTTTSNISVGTAQTTGTLTLGGTAQTGAITVGQSTGAQTLNLGTGATTNGTTKTINLGTAGVSGSTTTINIGSAVSGATTRTTLNGIVIDSISAAVSAAGSTQGTATALVSNINNVTVVAAAADGVILPTATAGMRILIRNSDAADTLKIYPATGAQINALGNNAAFSLTAGSTTELFASTSTQWYTF